MGSNTSAKLLRYKTEGEHMSRKVFDSTLPERAAKVEPFYTSVCILYTEVDQAVV